MANTLLVAFGSGEEAKLRGFAQALGSDFVGVSVSVEAATDVAATVLAARASGFSHVVAVSSMRSKDVLARVAGLLDAAMVTDAIEVVNETTFKRPVVAGGIIATVEVLASPVVITARAAGFPAVDGPAFESVDVSGESAVKIVSRSVRGGARPDLTQAKVIVSGGRPLKDAETFERVIGGLADKLGGAVGATRAAVDSGIAANELQVGQTGKIVAPNLYIAAGISGSTQHMAGIKDSKVIVAINKDADAPIFESADFGLVGDLYDVIPEIEALL